MVERVIPPELEPMTLMTLAWQAKALHPSAHLLVPDYAGVIRVNLRTLDRAVSRD